MERTSPRTSVGGASLGTAASLGLGSALGAVAVVLLVRAGGTAAPPQDTTLRFEADCRIVEAVRLEPLGDEAGESAFAATARCSASGGALRGASGEVDLVWAFDRGRLERDAMRWLTADGAMTTSAGTSVVRREADGRWRTDLQGTVAAAQGGAAGLAGRRYELVARLDASPLAPVADMLDDSDR